MFANMKIQKAFAVVLRRGRSNGNLTQADLALRTGLTSRYIRNLEAGRSCPTLDVVFKLAAALDMKAHALVTAVEVEVDSQTGQLRQG